MQRLGQEGLTGTPAPEASGPRRPPGPSPGSPRLFGIAGYKNAGKTTLIVDLLRELVPRGWRVATIKHAHHDFDIDQPGKDSHRHREAGASEVIVASDRRVAHVRELRGAPEPGLSELAGQLGPVDLVLVEGWKTGGHPRLELRRSAAPAPPIAGAAPNVLAIVSDRPAEDTALPVLRRADVAGIADFILAAVGLPPRPAG